MIVLETETVPMETVDRSFNCFQGATFVLAFVVVDDDGDVSDPVACYDTWRCCCSWDETTKM